MFFLHQQKIPQEAALFPKSITIHLTVAYRSSHEHHVGTTEGREIFVANARGGGGSL